MAKNGKNGSMNKAFGPLLLVAGAIGAPIIAAQVVKSVMKAPQTPQDAANAVTKGVYAYGGTSAALALLAGYTTGGVQAAAVGAALSTGILAGHAASVLLAIPKEALEPKPAAAPPAPAPPAPAAPRPAAPLPPPGAFGSGLPGVPNVSGYRRR